MDNHSIIDKKTFDVCKHEEDHPNVFICDKPIATSVAELNKKGYKTIASCSGHYRIEFYEYFDEDKTRLEEFKSNKRIIIRKIKENSFDYWEEVDFTNIYILFDQKYIFKTLPDNFNYDNFENKTCIRSVINFYNANEERKTKDEIAKEIDYNCKILNEWVHQLPNNK